MIGLKIKPMGRTALRLRNIKRHPVAFRKGIHSALHDAGKIAELHLITLIRTGARTGKIYKRPWGFHRASARGEPPKEDFSNLHRSVQYIVRSNQLEVGESLEYGETLEKGEGNLRGAKRPHIEATHEATQSEAVEFLKRRVSEALRRLQ